MKCSKQNSSFTKQSYFSITPRKSPSENIVGKGTSAGKQHRVYYHIINKLSASAFRESVQLRGKVQNS